jgi:hypothetical protein
LKTDIQSYLKLKSVHIESFYWNNWNIKYRIWILLFYLYEAHWIFERENLQLPSLIIADKHFVDLSYIKKSSAQKENNEMKVSLNVGNMNWRSASKTHW